MLKLTFIAIRFLRTERIKEMIRFLMKDNIVIYFVQLVQIYSLYMMLLKPVCTPSQCI